MLRPVARRLRIRIEHDPDVGRGGALVGREHRVEIHLRDFGEVGDELRHVADHRRQRRAIHALGAAHALQDLGRRDPVQHRQRVVLGCGREPERHVLHHLDQHAAEAERDQLAERRIGHRADDHFLAAAHHLLDLHAEELRLAVVLPRIGDDGREALAHFGRRAQSDQHAAGLGLVQDLRRHDLEHDRVAHRRGELRGLRGRRRDAFLRHRDAVHVAHRLALGRGQRRAPVRLHAVENLPDFALLACHRRSPSVRWCSVPKSRVRPDFRKVGSDPTFRSPCPRAAPRSHPCRTRARPALHRCARPGAASASRRSGCRTS